MLARVGPTAGWCLRRVLPVHCAEMGSTATATLFTASGTMRLQKSCFLPTIRTFSSQGRVSSTGSLVVHGEAPQVSVDEWKMNLTSLYPHTASEEAFHLVESKGDKWAVYVLWEVLGELEVRNALVTCNAAFPASLAISDPTVQRLHKRPERAARPRESLAFVPGSEPA